MEPQELHAAAAAGLNSLLFLLNSMVDLQTVTLDLRVLYKPDDKKLAELYRDVGPNENENGMLGYDNMVLPSIVKEVLKGTVASFDADKLVTEREAVSKMIREQLEARGDLYGVQIEDVAITDLNFSPVYARAVERKQISSRARSEHRFWSGRLSKKSSKRLWKPRVKQNLPDSSVKRLPTIQHTLTWKRSRPPRKLLPPLHSRLTGYT